MLTKYDWRRFRGSRTALLQWHRDAQLSISRIKAANSARQPVALEFDEAVNHPIIAIISHVSAMILGII